MGREIARCLSNQGYTVGLVARRLPLLESLKQELQGKSYCACIDVTSEQARDQLAQLIDRMGGLDLLVLSISAYYDNILSMNLPAVTVQNSTSYEIQLENFSMTSGRKRSSFTKVLKPGSRFSYDDVVRFTVYASDTSCTVKNIKNGEYIIISWSDEDDNVAIERYDSTAIIHAQESQETLCYDEEEEKFYVKIKR